MDGECVKLDTRSIDAFIDRKEEIVGEYDAISEEYDRIVRELMSNWQGRGADAFQTEASKVREGMSGVYDIIKVMSDTLTDCRSIFAECDRALGDFNREPGSAENAAAEQ